MTDSSNNDSSAERSGGHRPIAEESPSTIADVLGLITHDMRNPLAALSSNVGFLNMVSDGMSSDAREAVDDLQLSIEAMGRIIDSLELLCHDLKCQKFGVAMSLTVGSVVRAVSGQAERAAQSHGVVLKLDCGAHEADRFLAVENPFLRALSALIHNALTVAPPRTTVTMTVKVGSEGVSFLVEDRGPGLSPEFAEAALTASGQVDIKTASGGRYSRGLGLYVVARSAELAGVKLRIGETEQGSALELIAKQSA